MKLVLSLALTLLLAFDSFGAWGNGGKSASAKSPKFGTHDWIAFEGLELAAEDHNLDWLKSNLNAFFIGTEAPDVGAGLMPGAGGGYKDTATCHCILFDADGEVSNDKIMRRVQEEFDKAKAHFDKPHPTKRDLKLAAFYLGAMAHYFGDLSQFMHLMGKQSHWGSEDQSIHHRYEEVIDKTIVAKTKTSTLLSSFVKRKSVSGNTPSEIALSVARFTETGGSSSETPGQMYKEFKSLIKNGTALDTTEWDKAFLQQTGDNVNIAANGIAKLLTEFAKD
jgi:Zinc dependent phospholipase C